MFYFTQVAGQDVEVKMAGQLAILECGAGAEGRVLAALAAGALLAVGARMVETVKGKTFMGGGVWQARGILPATV